MGAGRGTQSIRLARAGHWVLAVEPDPDMRMAFAAALGAGRAEVRERVTVRDGSIGGLAAHVAPGGLLALAARTTTSARCIRSR